MKKGQHEERRKEGMTRGRVWWVRVRGGKEWRHVGLKAFLWGHAD